MPRKKNLLLFESKVHERVVVSRSTVMLLVGRLSGLAHPEFGGQIMPTTLLLATPDLKT